MNVFVLLVIILLLLIIALIRYFCFTALIEIEGTKATMKIDEYNLADPSKKIIFVFIKHDSHNKHVL